MKSSQTTHLNRVSSSPTFNLQNVQKVYNHYVALNGISFEVEKGNVGLLGPNGAGKSTLIKLLLGLLKLDGGFAEVLGYRLPMDGIKLRQSVGYMPENDSYLPYMTAVQYVCYAAELSGLPAKQAFRRAHEVLEYVGLAEARYRQLSGFSTGMKQRVKLAQALVHGPKLVFLDEPTNGLDPKGRSQMIELLQEVKQSGIQILLSSHILPDIEALCDHVVMLKSGELLYNGSLEHLYAKNESSITFQTNLKNEQFIHILRNSGFTVSTDGPDPKVYIRGPEQSDDILKLAVKNNIVLRHFMPTEMTLETAFLRLLDAN